MTSELVRTYYVRDRDLLLIVGINVLSIGVVFVFLPFTLQRTLAAGLGICTISALQAWLSRVRISTAGIHGAVPRIRAWTDVEGVDFDASPNGGLTIRFRQSMSVQVRHSIARRPDLRTHISFLQPDHPVVRALDEHYPS